MLVQGTGIILPSQWLGSRASRSSQCDIIITTKYLDFFVSRSSSYKVTEWLKLHWLYSIVGVHFYALFLTRNNPQEIFYCRVVDCCLGCNRTEESRGGLHSLDVVLLVLFFVIDSKLRQTQFSLDNYDLSTIMLRLVGRGPQRTVPWSASAVARS